MTYAPRHRAASSSCGSPYPHAIDALGFGQHNEINLRITKMNLRILVLRGHFAAKGSKIGAHRLIIHVIPYEVKIGKL